MFTLPKLPYGYDALEPYIDARTMEIHYTKHHQAYIDGLSKALAEYPDLQKLSVEQLLADIAHVPAAIRTAVQNNGGGHANHSLFWNWMAPAQDKRFDGPLTQQIVQRFGSFEVFQQQFEEAARTRFGSGWAWLIYNKQGALEVISTANQDSPLMSGAVPVLGLDVWEHAYYLKYQNKRVDYIKAWWHVVNWEYAQHLADVLHVKAG